MIAIIKNIKYVINYILQTKSESKILMYLRVTTRIKSKYNVFCFQYQIRGRQEQVSYLL